MGTAGWRGVVGGLALLLSAGAALAAGFGIREQSVTAQGNAFAGATAGAEDVSYMAFNPAALGRLDRARLAVEAAYVIPRAELESSSGTTAAGTPILGSTEDDDILPDHLIPAVYAMLPLGETWRAGIGLTVPFGLETSYSDDWVGRYHGVRSKLATWNINPVLAWRPTPWLSLGGGLQAQFADGQLSNAVDFGSIGALRQIPGAVPGAQDGFARLDGDDWGYGFTAGVLLEPRVGTRLGLAYRSEIEHRLSGDVDFSGDQAGIANALRAAGAFQDGGGSVDIETPATLSFGVVQELGTRWAAMAEIQRINWSSFDELRVEFDNPLQPDSFAEQDWRDTWFVATGLTFRPSQSLTLRAGVAYDQTPTRDRTRTPRIPDADRYWLAGGLGWTPTDWLTLTASYAHIFLDDSEVDLDAANPDNELSGGLTASYDNAIDVVSLSAALRF